MTFVSRFLSVLGRIARGAVAVFAVGLVLWSFYWVATRPLRAERLAPGQIRLTVLHWGDSDEDKIVAELLADFERRNPDIKTLRINPGMADAYVNKCQTMFASGDPPDVMYVGYEKLADWASKGLLAEIEPWMRRDTERGDAEAIDVGDYYPQVLDCFRFDEQLQIAGRGKLYGIAKDFTTVGFYYNVDLFRQAGAALPHADWTWDEFLTAARTIAKRDNCYGAEFNTWEAAIRCYVWTQGVDFASPDWREFRLADPLLRRELDRMRSWFFDEKRTLFSAKTQLETGQDPFLSGRIGMTGPFGRWKVPTYRHITDFEWDFAPLPRGKQAANGIFTTSWSMSSASKHPDAAWRLIRYLCGKPGQELMCKTALAIPTLRSVAESPLFLDPAAKPDNDRAYLDGVPYARPIDWPADPRYLHHLRVRLEDVFKSGALPVSAAMDQVERDWSSFRAENESAAKLKSVERVNWRSTTMWILVPLFGALATLALWWTVTQPGRLARREERAGRALISPWVIGFFAFTAFPIVLSLLLSFMRWNGLTPLDHASWVGMNNYRHMLLHDAGFHHSLMKTAYYVVLAVPLGQAAALGAALLMARESRGIGVFRSIWYLPSVLAGVGVAVLWQWVFHHEYGLLNALLMRPAGWIGAHPPKWFTSDAGVWGVPAFVIMSLWSVGGTMMIYLAGLKGISRDLYEAAEIDGATGKSRFWNVTLPMLSPVIFFNTIIALINAFQVFTQAYVMTGGGPGDATRFYVFYLFNQAFDFHEMGYASGMAWLLLLLILGLTLLVMRGSQRFVHYEGMKT
ncbi:MAG: extracellular solute-binding protein [Phycisphaerales bacterium]|nr:extracellular solute-binding protein [Phycisphaerales bacterium]